MKNDELIKIALTIPGVANATISNIGPNGDRVEANLCVMPTADAIVENLVERIGAELRARTRVTIRLIVQVLPRNIAECIDVVLGKPGRGNPRKTYDVMNPARFQHFIELLKKGVPVDVVSGAQQRIAASGWLKKPAHLVTDADLEELARTRPWEGATP